MTIEINREEVLEKIEQNRKVRFGDEVYDKLMITLDFSQIKKASIVIGLAYFVTLVMTSTFLVLFNFTWWTAIMLFVVIVMGQFRSLINFAYELRKETHFKELNREYNQLVLDTIKEAARS